MYNDKIINATNKYVRGLLSGEGSGHDWWHIYRVRKDAITIGKQEKANLYVVELAALLHDIDDWKLTGRKEPVLAQQWLKNNDVHSKVSDHVLEIINTLSFKGANVKSDMSTLEGKVVQDADRLDAIGAIGIARVFAYGGFKKREIYDPDKKPVMHDSYEKYKSNDSTSINHFYEKLLLLKDLMNTYTAKKIALDRHIFMEEFLERFFKEWDGKC